VPPLIKSLSTLNYLNSIGGYPSLLRTSTYIENILGPPSAFNSIF
jgi:hypothetical protein